MKVSLYANIRESKNCQLYDLDHMLADIRQGRYQDKVLDVRIAPDKKQRDSLKKDLPNFTVSGSFSQRRIDGLVEHSGFIAIDFDDIDDIELIRQKLRLDPYTYALFMSVSGNGLCCIVRIDPKKHRESFDALEQYYWNLLQIPLDPACKDVSRTRFVSYDPDLFQNYEAKTFKQYLSKNEERLNQEHRRSNYLHTQTKFDRVMGQITTDITGGYVQWRNIGFAFASEFKEQGRDYFHHISSFSGQYDQATTNKQYDACLRHNQGKITISTFYYFCKLAGYLISDPREDEIATLAYYSKTSGKDATEAAALVKPAATATDQEVIEAVYASDTYKPKEDKKQKSLNLADVQLWMRSRWYIRKNAITRTYELDGKELETEDLNAMFLEAKQAFEKLSREIFDTIIFSSNTPTYNPITEYLSTLVWDGYDRITPLSDSITSDTGTKEWRRTMLTKWMLGILDTIYLQEPNILCLVLAGEKNTGKTQFFKRLLPDPLRRYFANSQLDKGKDDDLLMTQKLIIFDDEYSGKSKQDAKHMKMMLSADTFTLREPYGRKNVTLRRMASLCGTCNETEILNDATGNRRIIVFEATGQFDYNTYNSLDKAQILAQVLQMHVEGQRSTLNKEEINQLNEYTSGRYTEVSIEAEMLHLYFESANVQNQHDWKTCSQIKDLIEMRTKQRLSTRKLGMELRRLGYIRYKKDGMYGYLATERAVNFTYNRYNSDEIAPF